MRKNETSSLVATINDAIRVDSPSTSTRGAACVAAAALIPWRDLAEMLVTGRREVDSTRRDRPNASPAGTMSIIDAVVGHRGGGG